MAELVLETRSVTVAFSKGRRGAAAERKVMAVDDVSIAVRQGEILGIVGESGSGKSTLCRAIAGLEPITDGEILFGGRPLQQVRSISDRRAIQMVFQDPYTSLNPRLRVGYVLNEALRAGGDARVGTASALLSSVGLADSTLAVRPSRLSGGQRQRVAIARALAVSPRVLLADEVTSALDVSIQATIVELLSRLAIDRNLALLFVTHNLQVVRALCKRVVVLHAGRVVEAGSVADIFSSPMHPYTQSLLAALPRLHRPVKRTIGTDVIDTEASDSTVDAEPGGRQCHFRRRCPLAHERCAQERPVLALVTQPTEHWVACHAVTVPKAAVAQETP